MIKKIIDKKLLKFGFKKVEEYKYGVSYKKEITDSGKYIHVVDLCHKNSGDHIIQSYEEECRKDVDGFWFNSVVGLSFKETFWFWFRAVISIGK